MALKHSLTTTRIPRSTMAGLVPLVEPPEVGQIVVAEVIERRRHKYIEDPHGARMDIFVGDMIVGAFGNRYATDQYEGYVPDNPVKTCHLLSIGGVLGRVRTRHTEIGPPTKLKIRGLVCDPDGRPINQRDFRLSPIPDSGHGQVILIVGTSMNSGKTTTAGTVIRALRESGLRVAAGKITGTAASHDTRYYANSGARPVLDFLAGGYPSTYVLDRAALLDLYQVLLAHLRADQPDAVVMELADGILQRETRMLLEAIEVQASVDHVLFCAGDSLAAAYGVQQLRAYGLPLRATTGVITQSRLAIREAEEATGVPCVRMSELVRGRAVELLNFTPVAVPSRAWPLDDSQSADVGVAASGVVSGMNGHVHHAAFGPDLPTPDS